MASKRVGVISISLTAGTADFISNLDKANAKVTEFTARSTRGFQEFGAHSVSSMQATSGGLRLLEGNFQNNIRASERFIATTLGLGPVIQAAFPLIGGLAFGGMLVDNGIKAYEFFKKMETEPERISGAFRELNQPLQTANDELRVSIDRVQMEIDKLQGKHTNTLALTLDEARVAADKLATALEGDLAKLNALLDSSKTGIMERIMGVAGDADLRKLLGGESGKFGGVAGDLPKALDEANKKIAESKTLKDQYIERTLGMASAAKVLLTAIDQVNAAMAKAEVGQLAHKDVENIPGLIGQFSPQLAAGAKAALNVALPNQQDILEKLKASKRTLQQALESV